VKDRILNLLMLLTVGAALALSLARGPGEPAGFDAALSAVSTAAPTAAPSPAEAYRARRAAARARDEELLTLLLSSPDTEGETLALARRQLLDMTKNDETELAVEAALAAGGCPDGLCVARRGEVTVFFPREISQREAALYLDIVRDASGLGAENIRLTGF